MRWRLRQDTAEAHRRLDAIWEGQDLAVGSTYGAFLRATAAALLPIEAGLEAAGIEALLPDWTVRRRSDAVRDDLAALGFVPPPAPPVQFARGSALLGPVYVLEGSRLGATLLLRRAAATQTQLRFLSHGAGGAWWSSILARLDALPHDGPQAAAIVAAALRCFSCFEEAAVATIGGAMRRAAAH